VLNKDHSICNYIPLVVFLSCEAGASNCQASVLAFVKYMLAELQLLKCDFYLCSPLLVAPRFGLDDAAHSDFDATLILATLMDSQLHSDESAGATHHGAISAGEPAISNQSGSRGHAHTNASTRRVNGSSASTPRSDQTAIWSELSGL
jgi:hypothetical protein